jgi:D-3-phosphoglycerate dehydrogenase
VAERLQGWQMRILAYDPYIPPESVPAHVQLVDYDTLLRESDLVSVLVAVTPESRGIISERALSLMKPTAFLINTARGDAVDEAALIRALQQKRIAGAALDNFQVEPLPADSPLWQLDNVILTPHMIGHTKDVFASFGKAGEDNILAILRGEAPPICKNPEVMPAFQARLQRLAQAGD